MIISTNSTGTIIFDALGGIDIGFKRAGVAIRNRFDSVYAGRAQHMQHAAKSTAHKAQFAVQEAEHEKRVKQITSHPLMRLKELSNIAEAAPAIALARPEIIAGSPPHLTSRPERPPEAFLLEAFAIIVATARPCYFVMENNIGVARSWHYEQLFDRMLRQSGYGLSQMIVRAAHFGAADQRWRFICAGCLGEPDNWLNAYLDQYRATRRLTVADILGQNFGSSLSECVPVFGADYQPLEHDDEDPRSSGMELRDVDQRTLRDLSSEARLFFCRPGGKDTGIIHRTDRPAPSVARTSLKGLPSAYRPKPGDKIDLRLLPQPTLEDFLKLAGFPEDSSPEWSRAGRSFLENKDLTTFQKRLQLANATPPPLAEAIGRAILDHRAKLERGEPHSKAWVLSGVPNDSTPPSPKQSEIGLPKIPPAYRSHLENDPKLRPRAVSQLLTDLKAAKAKVAHYQLKDAKAEQVALDQVFKLAGTSEGPSERVRRSQLRHALKRFAEWEKTQTPEFKQKQQNHEDARQAAEDDRQFLEHGPFEGSSFSPGFFESRATRRNVNPNEGDD